MTKQHAQAAPSSATMWLNCAASITLADGRTRPSSIYAKEGTAAHTIAEMIIGGDLFPPERITVEGQEFLVSREMLKHLNGYIDLVQMLQKHGDVWVETKVGLSYSQGMVWGTADCISWIPERQELTIVDLKYGKGVDVQPNSPQLKIYALAAMDTLKIFPDWINLTICQPRLHPEPKTHMMDFGALLAWGADDLRPAIQRLEDGDETEHAGSWCRWCVRQNECIAFAEKKSETAAKIFDDGVDMSLL